MQLFYYRNFYIIFYQIYNKCFKMFKTFKQIFTFYDIFQIVKVKLKI